MVKNTLIVALSLAFGCALTLAAQQTRGPATSGGVGFVSAQRIMAETAFGKAQAAKLQAFQQQRATELRTRQQTLENTRRELAAATDAARRTALQQQEQVQRTDFERATGQAQVDLQAFQRQVNTEVQTQVRAVLDELVKNSDVRVVLNAEAALLWGNPSNDLTQSVVSRMNVKSAIGSQP